MSRLQGKMCSRLKEACLITGCAQYDERLDACIHNLVPYNMYKISASLDQLIPEMPLNQQPQGKYPTAQFRPR